MIARQETPNPRITGGASTTRGRKRKANEDAFLCDPESGLFIVADGMGGENAGETASAAVVSVFPIMLNEMLPPADRTSDAVKTAIRKSLGLLSLELRRRSLRLPALTGLGSTAAILFVHKNTAFAAFAGDSRIYLFRNNVLRQISEDQTTVAELVRAGHISEEAAANHPLCHRLEQYIGKIGELNPGIMAVDLEPADRWMLCSDGLNKGLPDTEIAKLMEKNAEPAETSRILTETANTLDGSDNITVVVADVGETV